MASLLNSKNIDGRNRINLKQTQIITEEETHSNLFNEVSITLIENLEKDITSKSNTKQITSDTIKILASLIRQHIKEKITMKLSLSLHGSLLYICKSM